MMDVNAKSGAAAFATEVNFANCSILMKTALTLENLALVSFEGRRAVYLTN